MNPSGEIFSSLVNDKLGTSCPKCDNPNVCMVPNNGTGTPRKGDPIEIYVKFWERYIQDPTLIKKELHLDCPDCNGL